MQIGVPKEVKKGENCVGLTPSSVKALTNVEHSVYVESDAGLICGYPNQLYIDAGAKIVNSAEEIYQKTELIVKVKEPQPGEYELLKPKQILMSHLYLAHEKELANVLLHKNITALAYESFKTDNDTFPLLEPIEEIVGKVSVQIGARYLESTPEISVSRGVVMGGIVGVYPARVCIIGAGTIGVNAAKVACGAGASVCMLDTDLNKLKTVTNLFNGKVHTLYANEHNIFKSVEEADLLICAMNSGNVKSEILVTEKMIKKMKNGSVIIDTGLEQGSIVETMDKITDYTNPIYMKHNVIHYSVVNIPSMVARTSTIAMNNAIIPYVLDIANAGNFTNLVKSKTELRNSITTYKGDLTDACVAKALGLKYTELSLLIGF